MNALAITLHGLLATVWVGGMFFAYVVLRPSMMLLEPHRRLGVWAGVFKRFFPWVWMAVILLPLSGYFLVFNAFQGFSTSPLYVHMMHILGLLMIVLFAYLYFRPYAALRSAVESEDWASAGVALNSVRRIVLINLVLGMILIACVYAGRYGVFI